MKPILLIFDLDDTLVHSRMDFITLGRWIKEQILQKNLTRLSADELSTMSVSQMLKLVEEYDRVKGTSHGRDLWGKVEETEYQGMMQATVEAGAGEVLQELQARGFILTVLTNNSRKTADTVLRRFGLVDFFEQVVTRDEVEELKPHPAGILLIKNQYVSKVSSIYYIGDSWIDGEAAQAAGVSFIGFNLDREEVPMVTHVSNLGELLDFFHQVSLPG